MLKKGTKVRIKDAETLMYENNVNILDRIDIEDVFVPDMWHYCGQEATIIEARATGRHYMTYRLKFDGKKHTDCYSWNEYMFEEIDKEEYGPINIEDIL